MFQWLMFRRNTSANFKMMLCLLHKVHGVIFTCVFLHTQLHLQMVLPYLELTHTWFETNTFLLNIAISKGLWNRPVLNWPLTMRANGTKIKKMTELLLWQICLWMISDVICLSLQSHGWHYQWRICCSSLEDLIVVYNVINDIVLPVT